MRHQLGTTSHTTGVSSPFAILLTITLSLFLFLSTFCVSSVARGEDRAPGGVPYSDELATTLSDAFEAKGSEYKARTSHLDAQGKPLYTNRLILENSPYLLQHAHNPVDWHPWGDEAFEIARALGRPVLMSVGYTTCHWCHVMEEESFENLQIAQYINEHFVAIKVDRERRPDVDAIYMDAVRVLTKRGGWPMTVVMTPDRKPFFGGTYFPPFDGARGARQGFFTILKELERVYRENPERVAESAKQITQRIQQMSAPPPPAGVPGAEAIATAIQGLHGTFDEKNGGFGGQPKFPRPVTLDLLLRHHRRTGDPQSLHVVTHTLDKMADGGIYDHVGSGFHRYTVDAIWLTPHFEKMLYDNAQLVNVYLDAYQVTGHPKAARIAREVLEYVLREMTAPAGGFYSATDADSKNPAGHSEEGWFFTWTPDEVGAILEREEFRVFLAHHPVTPSGNFEGRNILRAAQHRDVTAEKLGIPVEELVATLTGAYQKLYAIRETRPKPILDDKVLVGWNGLMISAMARGGLILDDARFTEAARRAATFIKQKMWQGGALKRTSRLGLTSHRGVLNDYAFLIHGVLDLFESTQDVAWLDFAIQLQNALDAHFWDPAAGGYFMASDREQGLLVRQKPGYDGAVPAGNSFAARNLLRLHELTTKDAYRLSALKVFEAFSVVLAGGRGMPALASALDASIDKVKQIIIVRPNDAANLEPFLAVLRQTYLPNHLLVVVTEGEDLEAMAKRIPLIGGKVCQGGKVTAYVCEDRVCQLPTTDATVFAKQIAAVEPYAGKSE